MQRDGGADTVSFQLAVDKGPVLAGVAAGDKGPQASQHALTSKPRSEGYDGYNRYPQGKAHHAWLHECRNRLGETERDEASGQRVGPDQRELRAD